MIRDALSTSASRNQARSVRQVFRSLEMEETAAARRASETGFMEYRSRRMRLMIWAIFMCASGASIVVSVRFRGGVRVVVLLFCGRMRIWSSSTQAGRSVSTSSSWKDLGRPRAALR